MLFYIWIFASIAISVTIAMLIDRAVYKIWGIKIKAPVFITVAIFISLWWIFAIIVDATSG